MRTALRLFLLTAAAALVAGCHDAPSDVGGTDAGPSETADASPDAVAPPTDAGADGAVEPDAGPLPETGCFAGEVVLSTVTKPPTERAHLRVSAIVALDDGWLAFYESAEGDVAAFLELDGSVRATEPFHFSGGRAIVVGGSVVLVSAYEQTRIDVARDHIERVYAHVGIAGFRRIGRLRSDALRAVSVPEGDLRVRVTDLVIDDASPTGFDVREGVIEGERDVVFFVPFISGDDLLQIGQPTGDTWRAVRYQIDASTVGTAPSVGLTRVFDTTWREARSEGFVGATADLRHVIAERYDGTGYLTDVVPIPPATGATRVPGYASSFSESEGRLAILSADRLVALGRADLAPLAELPFPGPGAVAAQRGGRAAVIYSVGEGSSEASVRLRCLAVPAR